MKKDLKMPDVNVAELEKALQYIQNESTKPMHRRAKSSLNDENINLP